MTELLTVEALAEREPDFSVWGIRHALRNRDRNGLEASGAIVRDGRKILLDRGAYLAWAGPNAAPQHNEPEEAAATPEPEPDVARLADDGENTPEPRQKTDRPDAPVVVQPEASATTSNEPEPYSGQAPAETTPGPSLMPMDPDPTDAHAHALTALAVRKQASAHLRALRRELADAEASARRLEEAERSARDAIAGYRPPAPDRPPVDAEKLAEARAWLRTVKGDAALVQADMASLREAIAEADAAAESSLDVTAGVVATHQHARAELRARLDVLRDREADLEARAEKAPPTPAAVGSLQREREDLLAAVALGEANEGELRALEAALSRAEAEHAKAVAEHEAKAKPMRAALAGIRRRITEAEAELAGLEAVEPELIGHLLTGELTDVAERYQDAAGVAADLLLRAVAIYRLREKHGDAIRGGANLAGWDAARFPSLTGPAPILGVGTARWEAVQVAQAAELARLSTAGIEFHE